MVYDISICFSHWNGCLRIYSGKCTGKKTTKSANLVNLTLCWFCQRSGLKPQMPTEKQDMSTCQMEETSSTLGHLQPCSAVIKVKAINYRKPMRGVQKWHLLLLLSENSNLLQP